jgi:hypothetical protein
MSVEYFRGKLHGVGEAIAVCKHNPDLKASDVEVRLRNIVDQLSVIIGDDVVENYL